LPSFKVSTILSICSCRAAPVISPAPLFLITEAMSLLSFS
jgi:hypothetical protein